MRKLTSHIVDGDTAPQLTIEVLDEPGHGGACHRYLVYAGDPDRKHHECEINFQNGPIKEQGVNGVTEPALLAILIDRLKGFQAGPYSSIWNRAALQDLISVQNALQFRTRERIARGVEGPVRNDGR